MAILHRYAIVKDLQAINIHHTVCERTFQARDPSGEPSNELLAWSTSSGLPNALARFHDLVNHTAKSCFALGVKNITIPSLGWRSIIDPCRATRESLRRDFRPGVIGLEWVEAESSL